MPHGEILAHFKFSQDPTGRNCTDSLKGSVFLCGPRVWGSAVIRVIQKCDTMPHLRGWPIDQRDPPHRHRGTWITLQQTHDHHGISSCSKQPNPVGQIWEKQGKDVANKTQGGVCAGHALMEVPNSVLSLLMITKKVTSHWKPTLGRVLGASQIAPPSK